MASTTLFLAALASVVIFGSQGCVFLMGEAPDSLAQHPAGTHWTYGADWDGFDDLNTSWTCMTGRRQSPINVALKSPNTVPGQPRLKTTWSYTRMRSNGSNIKVFNNGHTVQVQWNTAELRSRILVPNVGGHVVDVTRSSVNASYLPVIATPLQLHFHTTSEHTLEGAYYPLELHIVHVVPQTSLPACPASGCLAVAGVMLALSDDDADNPTLDSIWSVMPIREGLVNYMPANKTLNIQALLPRNNVHQPSHHLPAPAQGLRAGCGPEGMVRQAGRGGCQGVAGCGLGRWQEAQYGQGSVS
ncbi:alpha-carbonic anhydrase domain-containing protein [Haematococcus lacustris]|uniref:Carbonic anhydrase n=1 Tax=Haematococcus lacustris TaxID=44745 RepID=A0A6A0A1L2_HAELA|nr:alpha-carbonic anhydrase domain-containing protein [Haematococcus lacustris]